LTVLSTVNFSGVSGSLPPTLRIKLEVASMTGSAQASLILYLDGGPSGSSQSYYFDFRTDGTWHLRRYHPETIPGKRGPASEHECDAERLQQRPCADVY
jgi:hypothetical protein